VRNNHNFLSLSILLPTVFLQFGCSGKLGSQASLATSFSAEVAVCDHEIAYPSGVILTGSAKFYKRGTEMVSEIVSSQLQLKNMVLGDPLHDALPIQNAEIAIYDQNLKLVQCGSTDSNGALKSLDTTSDLYLPNVAQNYRVRVLARSNYQYSSDPSDFLSVSIKKDTYKNEVHFIENFVYTDGANSAALDLVAIARQENDDMEITGGAFNILNNIQQTYDYIKNHTTAGTTNCLSKKLDVFWKAGFNPMQYLNPNSDPTTLGNTSYYLSQTNQLFISGGQLGDVSLSNTDHFDDFATVHELGHFIEKNCGQFTSPGGSHNFLTRIDPRLAWSEGWANYFATQVLNAQMPLIDPTMNSKLTAVNENKGWTFFFNSSGFSDSVQNIGNGSGFMIDFKKAGTNPGAYTSGSHTGSSFDVVNPTLYKGEGHTREGAITRGLFKLTHDCGTFCISTAEVIPFSEIWQSFDKVTGMAQPGLTTPFVSSYNFISKLKTVHSSWVASHDNTIASEALHVAAADFTTSGRLTWPGYGKRMVSGSCSLSIEPRFDDPTLTGLSSDQRYSNHNYTVDLNSLPLGTTSLTVTFTKSAGTDVDHDLLLFKSDFLFNDDYRCTQENSSGVCTGTWASQRTVTSDIVRSDRHAVSALSTSYTKTISTLNLLSASELYLLNIRSYTANKSIASSTKYDYVITANPSGATLCPAP
jgi:hypothetical protein